MSHRTIGIVGRDFCGSTMLLRLLSCIDGVDVGGELHWLTDVPPSGEVKTRAGWVVSRECTIHGSECPVFTKEFTSARHAQKDLYTEVAEAMGASVLVSADKMTSHYSRFVKRHKMDAIVLFKAPEAQAHSDMKNEGQDFLESLDTWASTYDLIIKWAIGEKFPKRAVFVSYEALAADPLLLMETLCRVLDLSAPPSDLLERFANADTDEGYHCIGCSPHSRDRSSVSVDEGWRPTLTDEQKRLCQHGTAARVLDRLRHLAIKP